jgi:hypothetical protein
MRFGMKEAMSVREQESPDFWHVLNTAEKPRTGSRRTMSVNE